MAAPCGLLFSDVDGTLVHYADALAAHGTLSSSEAGGPFDTYTPAVRSDGARALSHHSRKRPPLVQDGGAAYRVLALPPSSTGLQGYISLRTLQLVAQLRERRHRFAIVSGMRMSTFLQRLRQLPAACAYVVENGGRIFYPDSGAAPTAAPLVEDVAWRRVHAPAAGPAAQEALPAEQRAGPLWDAYRAFVAAGFRCDVAGYSTAVRVSVARDQPAEAAEAALAAALRALPASLTYAYNLGAADVTPATSGKANALRYLAARWGAQAGDARCVCMGDDDNDCEMAATASHAFLPGVNAETLAEAVRNTPRQFTVSTRAVFAATEDMLERVLARFETLQA